MEDKKSLTTGEVAKLCDVSIPTIHKWIKEGRIEYFKMPGSEKLRIPKNEAYKFMRDYGFPINSKSEIDILIISKNDDKNLEESLKRENYSVFFCKNMFIAGIITFKMKPSLIFIEADNEELIEIANKSKEFIGEDIVLIACSSSLSKKDIKKYKEYGFTDTLTTPIKISNIKKKISSHLKNKLK